MHTIQISNVNGEFPPLKAAVCDSFFSKFLGLMFRKSLRLDEGILLVENSESRVNSAIHMFFMKFDIGVIWINNDKIVVDKVLAQKWRPFYAPSQPARYTIEARTEALESFQIGDQVAFSND